MSYPQQREEVFRLPVALPEAAIAAWLHPTSRAYLQWRGLSQDESEQYELAYADVGIWRERVIIPMYRAGTLVAFQGRHIQDDHPVRYLTRGERPLYRPWDTLDGSRELCVVEGPFDLIAVQRVCPAIALLGNQISRWQWRDLIQLVQNLQPRKVWIWFDWEALTEAYTLQIRLAPYVPTSVIDTPPQKDPGMLREPGQVQAVFEYHAK
jgi:DNA primase